MLEKISHYTHYFDNSRFAGVIVLCSIILIFIALFTFIKHTWIGLELKKIANDTLKKEGTDRYSRTSLTMVTSFMIANYFAMYDFIKNGFSFEVFSVYIAIATGLKGLDILDKKYNGVKIDNSGANGTAMNPNIKLNNNQPINNEQEEGLPKPEMPE